MQPHGQFFIIYIFEAKAHNAEPQSLPHPYAPPLEASTPFPYWLRKRRRKKKMKSLAATMVAAESRHGGTKEDKSFRILHEDKFFTRLLSKETSPSVPSFRVYHTDSSGAVPFLWESRPGTPKPASAADSLLPPLTPPPSYLAAPRPPVRPRASSTLRIAALLSRLGLPRPPPPPPPPSHSSTSSAASSPAGSLWTRSRLPSSDSSSSSLGGDEDLEAESPRSTLCFGGLSRRRGTTDSAHGRRKLTLAKRFSMD